MKIRYQADADLNQAIVNGVLRREPTIDFQTAGTANLEGILDPELPTMTRSPNSTDRSSPSRRSTVLHFS